MLEVMTSRADPKRKALNQALRANLAKRKAQSRAVAAADTAKPGDEAPNLDKAQDEA